MIAIGAALERLMVSCTSAMVAGCVAGPAPYMPERVLAPALMTQIQIEDARGPLGPARADAAVRQIDPEGAAGLLMHHLAYVEDAIDAPLVLDNDAQLLIDGPQTKDAMFDAMAAAERHIDLETYILEAEGAGERLLTMLGQKRSEGVQVRVLYDSFGSLATPAEYFEGLKAIGAMVCEFNPVNPLSARRDKRLTINNRDHRKILIVDDSVAFTGGINISAVYSSGSFGQWRKPRDRSSGWRDTHVLVRGPVVAQFQQLFDTAWREQDCPVSDEPDEMSRAESPPAAGNMAVRLVAADPHLERSELYIALTSAIEHARERVWLTYGYFVPDERTIAVLQEASRRGVDVRLALPGFSDFWAPFHAGRSHYTSLLTAGVRIFERHDALLHAKTAVIDGVWSSVGSTNLDWRSFVHNYEADLLVLDRDFAAEMESLFQLDEEASQEIVEREWKRRNVSLRLLEWLARQWEYLL